MSKLTKDSYTIFWLAGENSADIHSSIVMKSLNSGIPGVRHIGIGGPLMQTEGLLPLFPFASFNVMGFVEVAGHLGFFLEGRTSVKKIFSGRKA
jgi:lipid-A-disaccharide synthase